MLRRRKSIDEIVLERNLCFVDTPTTSLSRAGQTDAIVQYMRQQLLRATAALEGAGIDFQNLLAGNGGSQVDAVVYLISNGKFSRYPGLSCSLITDLVQTLYRQTCSASESSPT